MRGPHLISDNTNKIRKLLLIFSIIGILISKVNVSIVKITILGTEFRIGNYEAIPTVLGIIIIYFLFAFFFHAIVDYYNKGSAHIREQSIQNFESVTGLGYGPVSIQKKIDELNQEIKQLKFKKLTTMATDEIDNKIVKLNTYLSYLYSLLAREEKFLYQYSGADDVNKYFSYIRWSMEFLVPVIVGIYSCILIFLFTDFKIDGVHNDKSKLTIITDKVIVEKKDEIE